MLELKCPALEAVLWRLLKTSLIEFFRLRLRMFACRCPALGAVLWRLLKTSLIQLFLLHGFIAIRWSTGKIGSKQGKDNTSEHTPITSQDLAKHQLA